jgi:hypothetical protein
MHIGTRTVHVRPMAAELPEKVHRDLVKRVRLRVANPVEYASCINAVCSIVHGTKSILG